jgi:hypothetical protein
MLFSQRYKFKPIKDVVQIESMDDDLRNSLWSALKTHYWDAARFGYPNYGNVELKYLCTQLWFNFFKKPIDTLPDEWTVVNSMLRGIFFKFEWYEVYDFIEFIVQTHDETIRNENFIDRCNRFLEREVSAYRFVGNQITRIVSSEEMGAVEDALRVKLPPVREHLNRALTMLADRKKPDYRNSIKESISAVEALVKTVTKSDRGTLGELLSVMERQGRLHPALKSAFSKLYGYTSDADGIRHALMDEDRVTFEEAKFMLVTCSAFTNYVKGTIKT